MAAPRSAISRRQNGLDQQETEPPPSTIRIPLASPNPPGKDTKAATPPSFLSTVAYVQARAQAFLCSAVASERAKRWQEAIDYYRKLLNSLSKKNFPQQYVPGPICKLLLFETHYHVGVAFQKMNNHREALEEFTLALETSNIPKNACQVGCASGSFYQIPVLARRAYSYVRCGRFKEAIRDSTRAVHLDPSNSDVYCIRALVWSSVKEKRRALVDLNDSFKLNSSHIPTLILRGAILSSLGGISSEPNKDHVKAISLCVDSENFCDVEDFYNPKIPLFYDKFLWPLNAFHTIMEINLFDGATISSRSNKDRVMGESNPRRPFRCGSKMIYSDNTALERRKTYTQTCRESVTGVNVKKDSSSSVTFEMEEVKSLIEVQSRNLQKEHQVQH